TGTVDGAAWTYHTANAGTLDDVAAGIAKEIEKAALGYPSWSKGTLVYIRDRSSSTPSPIKLGATGGGGVTLSVAPDYLALLDEPFGTLLQRFGFLFQIMTRLNLSAENSLAQLLVCWAPIGTAGQNSLYKKMFLSPTFLQQDPGAQTATIAGPAKVG